MPVDKNKLLRFQVIDRCLCNPYVNYYIDDSNNEGLPNLLDECNKALAKKYGDVMYKPRISRRTIFNDINEIEDLYQTQIVKIQDGKRKYYKYEDPKFSIEKAQQLTEAELQQLQETIGLLNRFRGLPQFVWMENLVNELQTRLHIDGHSEQIIGFESNEYVEGLDWLEPLFQYIVNKQVLKIQYHPYHMETIIWTIHPYYIKQHNNRWFLFGLVEDEHRIVNMALDRISDITPTRGHYIASDIDFSEYFDDVLGVTIPENTELERVLLRFTPYRFPYVLTKPIHHSQKLKDREGRIIEILVKPNNELVAQILWFGEDVEVLQPVSLRHLIAEKVKKMRTIYE